MRMRVIMGSNVGLWSYPEKEIEKKRTKNIATKQFFFFFFSPSVDLT